VPVLKIPRILIKITGWVLPSSHFNVKMLILFLMQKLKSVEGDTAEVKIIGNSEKG
jgi:hypothetical protein